MKLLVPFDNKHDLSYISDLGAETGNIFRINRKKYILKIAGQGQCYPQRGWVRHLFHSRFPSFCL